MNLKTGVDSQGTTLHENLDFLAPLPNFGLLVMFKVNSWLRLNGKFGMFYLRLNDFSGKINGAIVSASFNVYRWVYINLTYKIYDISVVTYTRDIKTTVDYNFRGPGLGVALKF